MVSKLDNTKINLGFCLVFIGFILSPIVFNFISSIYFYILGIKYYGTPIEDYPFLLLVSTSLSFIPIMCMFSDDPDFQPTNTNLKTNLTGIIFVTCGTILFLYSILPGVLQILGGALLMYAANMT